MSPLIYYGRPTLWFFIDNNFLGCHLSSGSSTRAGLITKFKTTIEPSTQKVFDKGLDNGMLSIITYVQDQGKFPKRCGTIYIWYAR